MLLADNDELYALSYSTGATRADSAIDIDGGAGALMAYSGIGRRELPNQQVWVDGDVQGLSRDGSFVGQHIITPRHGVAVQINAFNFPSWGMLEKFAPAFLAGVPSIVKPATPTAYVTEAVVRRIIDSGLLPDGALQFVAGSVDGLLDVLDEQDTLSFTGSAATGTDGSDTWFRPRQMPGMRCAWLRRTLCHRPTARRRAMMRCGRLLYRL